MSNAGNRLYGYFNKYKEIRNDINSNFTKIKIRILYEIRPRFNGGGTSLDTTIKSKANIADLLPIGSYIQFAGSQAPAGFLVCNGGAISRTTYSKLFAVIGTTYGSGDGSTTFNLPNLTDRFLQGSTTSGTVKDAGLPNISGLVDLRYPAMSNPRGGALSWDYTNEQYSMLAQDIATQVSECITFDASWSNSIYGNSATVQPPALTCLICIKY